VPIADCIFLQRLVWKFTIGTEIGITLAEITWCYSIDIATTRFMRSMYDKHQAVEEPCEGNLSSTVLQTSRVGDCPAEFNSNPSAGPNWVAIVGGIAFIRLFEH
jgi:hypothetical protein